MLVGGTVGYLLRDGPFWLQLGAMFGCTLAIVVEMVRMRHLTTQLTEELRRAREHYEQARSQGPTSR